MSQRHIIVLLLRASTSRVSNVMLRPIATSCGPKVAEDGEYVNAVTLRPILLINVKLKWRIEVGSYSTSLRRRE
jgi:hypothetical protein